MTATLLAPRIPMVDPRTGMMAREWYQYFIAVGTNTDISLQTEQFQIAPVQTDNASFADMEQFSIAPPIPPAIPTPVSIGSARQNVITTSKTLDADDMGTNILLITAGITLTFPSAGFASGEGVAVSNVSGGNVTLSCPGGSDFGATLPNNGSLFIFGDGGGFWRQYCYSTARL